MSVDVDLEMMFLSSHNRFLTSRRGWKLDEHEMFVFSRKQFPIKIEKNRMGQKWL